MKRLRLISENEMIINIDDYFRLIKKYNLLKRKVDLINLDTKDVLYEIMKFVNKRFDEQQYSSKWIKADGTEITADVGYGAECWEIIKTELINEFHLIDDTEYPSAEDSISFGVCE